MGPPPLAPLPPLLPRPGPDRVPAPLPAGSRTRPAWPDGSCSRPGRGEPPLPCARPLLSPDPRRPAGDGAGPRPRPKPRTSAPPCLSACLPACPDVRLLPPTTVRCSKETHCEFCDCELPSWKRTLTPTCGSNAPAVMNVNFDGRTYSFEVKPGMDGYRQFTEAIR